jgi:hypothetical protein
MPTVAPETSPPGFISLENLLLDYPEGVILRSQDSTEFRVPKLYLIHNSPILREELLNSPNPQPGFSVTSTESGIKGSPGEAHRVVHLPVNGTILNSLISYIFPVPPILPSTTEQIMELLSIAQMYKMDVVLTHIRNHIAQQQPSFIRKETAFSVYALAQKYGLCAEALQAARCTLSFSTMNIYDLSEENQLELMPGAFLHDLWKYHQRARTNLTSDLEEFKRSQLEEFKVQEDSVSTCELTTDEGIPDWLDDYISRIGSDSVPAFLDFTNFHLEFIEHREGLHSHFGDSCYFCRRISIEDLRALWKTLMTVVQSSITRVRFTHVAALSDGSERGAQAESEFEVGVEGARSENEIQPRSFREGTFMPKYLGMPGADVILQSSDHVNFHVHRSVLVKSSPFFRDMFSLPQPSSDASDELPMVHVSETAEVLNSLISMLYHVPPEMPRSSDDILALLAATDKYDMGTVQSSIRAEVSRRELLSPIDSSRVFHLYAIAYSKRLIPEMEAAARLTLDYPMTFESIGEALRSFDVWALRILADFRLRCARNLSSGMESFVDIQSGPSKIWAECPFALEHRDPPGQPLWLNRIFNLHFESDWGGYYHNFAETIPTTVQIRDEFLQALKQHVKENDCHFCLKVYMLKGKEYCSAMDDILEQARNLPLLTSGYKGFCL